MTTSMTPVRELIMYSRWGCYALLLLMLGAAPARGADDVVMKAMRDELARSMERLQLENLEKPYFIAYRIVDISGVSASASFGSLLNQASPGAHSRMLFVELRVGGYAFDNTNYFSFSFGDSAGVARMFGGMVSLPIEDDYKEIRRQLWLATDNVYKKALEDISKKRAALQNKTRTEEVADFSRVEPSTLQDLLPPAEISAPEAEKLVRELSALFREMPDVSASSVEFQAMNLHVRYLNSEGTSFIRTKPVVRLLAEAQTQAPDGMPLVDYVAFYARSTAGLPAKEVLAARVRAIGANLAALRKAPMLDRYSGPVLFESQAAAELFSQVFASKLAASRRPVMDDARFDMFSTQLGNPFLDKLGSRVLPSFLSVTDNPQAAEFEKNPLLGTHTVDDEGVPAREVRLVERGILKTLLATRAPVRGIAQSSGSRRGGGPAPSNLFLTAENGVDESALKEQFLNLVKQRNAEFGILIRRIANPSLAFTRDPMAMAGFFMGGMTGAADIKGIILAYRVFPDGREELIRNAEMADPTLAAFKDIVAASKSSSVVTFPFAARSSFPFSVDMESLSSGGGALVSFVVPSLLFEDITLKRPSGEIPKPPVVKHPFF